MLKHNIKLAFRNFKKDKSTFLINLIGLSTGLACAIMIFMWVNDEVNVDKFHEKDSQLYQARINHQQANRIVTTESTQGLLGDALAAEIPEVEMAVTCSEVLPSPFVFSHEDKNIKGMGHFAGRDYFKLFSYELLEGDRNTLLKDKKSIVISESLAMKLFNSTEVLGKVMTWSVIHFKGEATVTGVYKEIGNNSSNRFDFALPYEVFRGMMGDGIHWDNFNALTYLRLQKDTDAQQLNTRLEGFIKTKLASSNATVFVAPYSDSYLHGTYENGKNAGGRIEYVRLFSIIAIFILLIACINFMNLSTAKATRKSKEVGVRKTIGADRRSLVQQYLGESIFMALFALVVALVLVLLTLPSFNVLTGKAISFPWTLPTLFSLLGITLLTGIIAGSYPALYLSGFSPAKVLKGAVQNSIGEILVRKGLVVFQFSMSVILIVAVMVVYKQIEFIQNKNIGYNKENVITFPKEGKSETNLETFLTQLKNIPGIVSTSSTNHSLIFGGNTTIGVKWEGKDPDEIIQFTNIGVYYDFIETLGIELVQGRSFSKEFGTEDRNLILNETAIKAMGLTEPIGKTIQLWGDDVTIVGVVKDFHFDSLHDAVEPMFLRFSPDFLLTILARIEAGKEQETVSNLAAFYKKNNPGYDFEYSFLDANYQSQYIAETRVSLLSRYFAGLAILISCLGLFGLSAFTAQRRIKEISIRKVLGANPFSIVRLLTFDFTKMVLVAIGIGLPVSYFITKNWLEDFAFHVDLSIWFFVVAGVLTLAIAWLTISLQTVKAASVNPSDNLKE